jgi:hypothetical protein
MCVSRTDPLLTAFLPGPGTLELHRMETAWYCRVYLADGLMHTSPAQQSREEAEDLAVHLGQEPGVEAVEVFFQLRDAPIGAS